jgi:hypothetical protein
MFLLYLPYYNKMDNKKPSMCCKINLNKNQGINILCQLNGRCFVVYSTKKRINRILIGIKFYKLG